MKTDNHGRIVFDLDEVVSVQFNGKVVGGSIDRSTYNVKVGDQVVYSVPAKCIVEVEREEGV